MEKPRGTHQARLEEVRRRLGEAYEPAVRKVKKEFPLWGDLEVRDALHTVSLRLLVNGAHPIRNWVAYLTTAAINECRQGHQNGKVVSFSELSKEERRRIVEETPGPFENPADLAAKHELVAMAQEEVENLPPKQRAILLMVCSKYKHREIAAALGLRSAETSRSHLRYALKSLRKMLRARGFFDCTFWPRKHSRV